MPLLLTDAQNLLSDLIARYLQVDYLVIRLEEAKELIFCCVATGRNPLRRHLDWWTNPSLL